MPLPDDPGSCERCGARLPTSDSLGGACPRCMLTLGLDVSAGIPVSAAAADHPDRGPLQASLAIAHYRILRVIGEGGMGTVYEAEQDHPRRAVALKIIKPGRTTPKLLQRFEQESQALGRLQHPGIAQIHEAGTADAGLGPQPYFAMELIRGETLDAYAEARHLTVEARLEMVARVADAVHHAHQRGVIHRDLKPGNIVVDETGQPKVLDFGIARAVDGHARAAGQTEAGQLLGTLTYMSPEQTLADPLEVDTRSDVYALGVILYELLAGRHPYAPARSVPDVVRAIQEREPVRLGLLDRRCRGDIETIVATALEKDKARRYGSAADLAADIRRYLTDQPIVARPPSTLYQLQKFARRNRVLVSSVAAMFIVLVMATIVSLRERNRATAAEATANDERNAALAAQRQALRERDSALSARAEARRERDRALRAEAVSARDRERAEAADARAREDRDRLIWQNMARESIGLSGTRTDDDLAALLARQAWLLSARVPSSSSSTVVQSALQLASRLTSWSHQLSHNGEVANRVVALSPDGTSLAVNGSNGDIEIWDVQRPGVPPRLLEGRAGLGPLQFVAFSPDGRYLASGGFESNAVEGAAAVAAPVRIWDLHGGDGLPLLLKGHPREVRSGAFSPDGRYLVTVDTAFLLLWDMRSPSPGPRVLEKARPVQTGRITAFVTFSSDWRLAVVDADGVRLWDARNPVRPSQVVPGSEQAMRVAFSPDGSQLAVAALNGVRLIDLHGRSATRVLVNGSRSLAVGFSPDGRRLAASIENGSVGVWDVSDPAARSLSLGGQRGVGALLFSPDGSRLFSSAGDGTVRVRELQSSGAPLVLNQGVSTATLGQARPPHVVMFSSNGDHVHSGVENGTVRRWDRRAPSGTLPQVMAEALGGGDVRHGLGPSDVGAMDLSADGTRIALADTAARVWDVRNPQRPVPLLTREATPGIPPPGGRPLPITAMKLAPDGRQLALSRRLTNSIELWDLETHTVRTLRVAAPFVSSLAYSADGSKLAAAHGFELSIWNLRRPDPNPLVIATPAQPRPTFSLAFARDGSRLATGAEDVHVWDLRRPTAAPVRLRGVTGTGVDALAFSPDGRLLAGSLNAVTQLWDLTNPATPPTSLPGATVTLAFHPTGRYLATGTRGEGVRVWSLGAATADDLCTRVWRNLTLAEWRYYAGESIPYERTCPDLPPGQGPP